LFRCGRTGALVMLRHGRVNLIAADSSDCSQGSSEDSIPLSQAIEAGFASRWSYNCQQVRLADIPLKPYIGSIGLPTGRVVHHCRLSRVSHPESLPNPFLFGQPWVRMNENRLGMN
jgi:hypothetical protein